MQVGRESPLDCPPIGGTTRQWHWPGPRRGLDPVVPREHCPSARHCSGDARRDSADATPAARAAPTGHLRGTAPGWGARSRRTRLLPRARTPPHVCDALLARCAPLSSRATVATRADPAWRADGTRSALAPAARSAHDVDRTRAPRLDQRSPTPSARCRPHRRRGRLRNLHGARSRPRGDSQSRTMPSAPPAPSTTAHRRTTRHERHDTRPRDRVSSCTPLLRGSAASCTTRLVRLKGAFRAPRARHVSATSGRSTAARAATPRTPRHSARERPAAAPADCVARKGAQHLAQARSRSKSPLQRTSRTPLHSVPQALWSSRTGLAQTPPQTGRRCPPCPERSRPSRRHFDRRFCNRR